MPAAAPADRRPGWAGRLVRDAVGLTSKARLTGLVLATYADQRTGEAWPKLATLAEGAGLSVSGVQRALRELERRDLIRAVARLRYAKKFVFQIGQQSDQSEPAQTGLACDRSEARKTGHHVTDLKPARLVSADGKTGQGGRSRLVKAVTDRTSRGTSREGSLTASSARAKADPFPRPDGIDAQVWADFLVNRARKKMANTPTAHKRLVDDLARLSDDDWPPGRLVEHAAAKGWGGIYRPDNMDRSNGRTTDHRRNSGGDSLVELWRQASADADREEAEAARAGQGADPGTGSSLSPV